MRSVIATLLALTLSALAFDASAAGNAEEGKKRFYTCTGCHGIGGTGSAGYRAPTGGRHRPAARCATI